MVICKNCGGRGTTTINCTSCSGTGVQRTTGSHTYYNSKGQVIPSRTCQGCKGTGKIEETCIWCDGVGSWGESPGQFLDRKAFQASQKMGCGCLLPVLAFNVFILSSLILLVL